MPKVGCWKRISITLAVLVIAGAGVVLVAELRLRRGEAAMQEDWRRLLGVESFEAAFPDQPANETALRLEGAARSIGIEIPLADLTLSPAALAQTRWNRASPAIQEFVRLLVRQAPSRDSWPDLDPAGQSYLRWAEPQLLRLAQDLEQLPPPQFARNLEDPTTPQPGSVSLLSFHKVLITAAARAVQSDRPDLAERYLNAAWRLGEALREEPLVISQLVSLAMLQQHLAVLRGQCSSAAEWPERLRTTNLPGPLRIALEAESHHLFSLARWEGPVESYLFEGYFFFDPESDRPGSETFHQPLLRPAIRWGLRDAAVRYHRHFQGLDGTEPKDFNAGAFCRDFAQAIPRWQLVGHIVTTCLAEVWTRALARELQLELTEQILQQRLRPNGENYRVESRAVPGLFWLKESAPDEIVIRLERGLTYPPANEPPWLYRLHATDCP